MCRECVGAVPTPDVMPIIGVTEKKAVTLTSSSQWAVN